MSSTQASSTATTRVRTNAGTSQYMVGVGPSRDPVDPLLGELDTIAVDPAHWRVGIGRCLMVHALGVLRKSWARAILWTPADYGRGHAFYRATGWVPLDRSRRDGKEVAFGQSL
jgi:GNAT superfamily N-acetyltransferase